MPFSKRDAVPAIFTPRRFGTTTSRLCMSKSAISPSNAILLKQTFSSQSPKRKNFEFIVSHSSNQPMSSNSSRNRAPLRVCSEPQIEEEKEEEEEDQAELSENSDESIDARSLNN